VKPCANNHGIPRRWRIFLVVAALACVNSVVNAQDPNTSHRLSPGDRIKVTVYGHDDLSGEFELDGEGSISLPLIRVVPAAGLTANELEGAITDKLKPDYLRNPSVTVEVLSYRPFYIIGEIKAPGAYPYVNGMTVLNAVALAGGYTYRARTKSITIKRQNGQTQNEIRAKPETPVLPGDVIEVPERYF